MENIQKLNFVKLIYLISRVFLAWTFLHFPARCENVNKPANVGVVDEEVVVLPMLDSPV